MFSMNELILACLLCASNPDHTHDHDYGELAIVPGATYLVEDKEFAFGLHLHGLVSVGESWAIGLGYERIFANHAHNSLGLVVQYNITHHWSVAAAPGIAFDEHEVGPAIHIETAYSFKLGPLHWGPALEGAFDMHDSHFTLGAHAGFGF